MISFKTTCEDGNLIDAIVRRADVENRFELLMDLTACHANGCPLDLEGLLNANGYDFFHDITDIVKHLNRTTGKLENCFSPRYARRDA